MLGRTRASDEILLRLEHALKEAAALAIELDVSTDQIGTFLKRCREACFDGLASDRAALVGSRTQPPDRTGRTSWGQFLSPLATEPSSNHTAQAQCAFSALDVDDQ